MGFTDKFMGLFRNETMKEAGNEGLYYNISTV